MSKLRARELVVDSLTLSGVNLVTALLLASGQVVDLNGEAYGLVLDADADTAIGASVDDIINIKINGAEDFRFTANVFTALSGSSFAADTVSETTSAAGVTIDGVLLKDAQVTTDVINEKTAAAGVTADGVLLKDSIVNAGSKLPVAVITGDGAISITPGVVALTKGSAAAITLAAPTATTHDGYQINVYSETAFAHVITGSVDGFNAKGSSGTVTLGGAKGDGATFTARNGHWWVTSKINATVA